MGTDNLNAALNAAGFDEYAVALPPDDLDRAFDFADFTALNVALEQVYGQRGGRGIALLCGRACFSRGLRRFGALAGLGAPTFRSLPHAVRVEVGLKALAEVFNRFSDQGTSIEVCDDHFRCTVNPRRRAGSAAPTSRSATRSRACSRKGCAGSPAGASSASSRSSAAPLATKRACSRLTNNRLAVRGERYR
ncbi:MAG: hypothetical protein M5R40_01190 [Anaerolineae bacterium]|nr:hypothetical protein [Anaerolineae bacterium]